MWALRALPLPPPSCVGVSRGRSGERRVRLPAWGARRALTGPGIAWCVSISGTIVDGIRLGVGRGGGGLV